MFELLIGLVIIYVVYVIGVYVASMFGRSSDVMSVLQVAGIFLGITFVINFLELNSIIATGIMGIASIFLFTKFFDHEPMAALMSGVIFGVLTNVLAILIAGGL